MPGRHPPGWERAKKAVMPHAGRYQEPWAVVKYVAKRMGAAASEADDAIPDISEQDLRVCKQYIDDYLKEAIDGSALGQLTRPGVKKLGNECCGNCLGKDRKAAGCCKESRRHRYVLPLREARLDLDKRQVRCIVITEGPGNDVDGNYYSKEAIATAPKAFDGAKCFINHQTEAERKARPEGDVWSEAGYWLNPKVIQTLDRDSGKTVDACEATVQFDKSEAGNLGLAKARAAIEYAKRFPYLNECYAGLSINTDGLADGTVESDGQDRHNIIELLEGGSIDVVTRPARGGAFKQLLESVKSGAALTKTEVRTMTIAEIKVKLTEARKARAKLAKATEVDPAAVQAIDDKIDGLLSQLVTADKDDPTATEQDNGEEKPAGEQDDMGVDAIKEQLKQLVPQHEGEQDMEYDERINAIAACRTGEQDDEKKADEQDAGEPVVIESAKDLKKFQEANPEAYHRIAGHLRKQLGEEHKDFGKLRGNARKLAEENKTLQIENRIMKDQRIAERLLTEAEIPESILSVDDLVGKSEKEMTREIARYTQLSESMRFGGGFAKTATGEGAKGSGVDPSSYGVAVKKGD